MFGNPALMARMCVADDSALWHFRPMLKIRRLTAFVLSIALAFPKSCQYIHKTAVWSTWA